MEIFRVRSPASIVAAIVLGILAVAKPAAAEELFVEGKISSHLARDMDGDGLCELWVAYHRDEQRFLALFRGKETYSRAPDRIVPVDPQAVLFSVGDYGPESGLELVLMSRSSGIVLPSSPSAASRRIFKMDLFFGLPSVKELLPWQPEGVLDLDGDGRDDFILPEKERLRLLMSAVHQADGSVVWQNDISLPISYYLLLDGRQERIRQTVADFAGVSGKKAAFVSATGAFPFPLLKDFDGDGRLDVIVKRLGNVFEVHRQEAPGVFTTEVIGELPWMKDASSLTLVDINDDGKLDIVSSRILLKDLASEIKVFLQRSDEPAKGFLKPQQILKVSGFFRRPELGDVNGDDRLDLIVAAYRVDLLDQLKGKSVDELEISYQVFLRTQKSTFSRVPAIRKEFTLRTASIRRGRSRPSIYCGEDATGDGLSDVVFIDSSRWLRLYRARGGSKVAYDEVKGFAARVPDPDQVALKNVDRQAGVEVLLIYPRSLRVARFRS